MEMGGKVRFSSAALVLLLASCAWSAWGEERAVFAERAAFIPVHGEIDRSLVVFLRRGMEKAKKQNVRYIVFDVDTFGGRVDSALQIATLIGSAAPSTSVAYVTAGPESTGVSWSAGALISLACSRIYMAPGTSMGAAAPVSVGPEGALPASEKVVSALRAQIAAFAEKNGYPVGIARAMVDQDIELREVFVGGEMRVAAADEIEEIEREAKRNGRAFETGKVVSPRGKLLTLTAMEMERYGVSSGTVSDREGLLHALGLEADAYELFDESPADRAVGIVTSGGFTALLILIGLVALFIEITTPGFGVPGTVAIICFAIVFSSYALLGTVGSLELMLFVVGLVLLILEIFVIPGFGVAGVSGILLIVASLVLSMQEFIVPNFEWQRELFRRNLLVVGFGVVSALGVFGALAFAVPKFAPFKRLTLSESQTVESGYTVQTREEVSRYIGKKGVAVTTLRPSGKAEFGEEVLSVETDGEFVEKGSEVEVIEVSANRILVRKC
jgi:membrane-bound serine protease (ClpP class)